MSKSFEWCIDRAKNHEQSNYKDRKWEDAREYSSEEILEQMFEKLNGFSNHWSIVDSNDENNKIEVFLEIKPDSDDFEYFTSHSSVHDGTLMFVMESMTEVLGRVMSCRTCRKGMEPPKWGDIIHYTIGNLVVLDEFDGDWVPKDKPWCTERTTVLLPIKVEVLKKEDTEV